MDIHVRRIHVKRCRNEGDCKSGNLHLWSDFWRELGHECPSYMHPSRSDSDFWNDPEQLLSCMRNLDIDFTAICGEAS